MKQKTISRRINKELEKLMPGEYSYTQVDKLEIMVNDYLLYFVFPDTYPFKSPKVYIKKENGKIKDYIDSFINFKIKNGKFIKDKLKSDWCPCCHTIICDWSPRYTIHNIIYEFQYYESMKNTIVNLYIINKAGVFIDIIENHIISFLSPIFQKFLP